MKKRWIVGINAESKVVMREYQDDNSREGLRVHHIFVVSNPQKNHEVKAWCDAMRQILIDREEAS